MPSKAKSKARKGTKSAPAKRARKAITKPASKPKAKPKAKPRPLLAYNAKVCAAAKAQGKPAPKVADVMHVATPGKASTAGYHIEPNRPEKHGFKQPSAGTETRALWDAFSAFQSRNGRVPELGGAKAIGAQLGKHATTTVIQYYRWRKFNGVRGRQS